MATLLTVKQSIALQSECLNALIARKLILLEDDFDVVKEPKFEHIIHLSSTALPAKKLQVTFRLGICMH